MFLVNIWAIFSFFAWTLSIDPLPSIQMVILYPDPNLAFKSTGVPKHLNLPLTMMPILKWKSGDPWVWRSTWLWRMSYSYLSARASASSMLWEATNIVLFAAYSCINSHIFRFADGSRPAVGSSSIKTYKSPMLSENSWTCILNQRWSLPEGHRSLRIPRLQFSWNLVVSPS